MKLYCTPAGTWAGSEASWKAACKAEGTDPKLIERKTVEVPVSKAELMEFLTFHGVNPINPRPVPQVVGGVEQTPLPPAPPPAAPAAAGSDTPDLDALFDEAPIGVKLRLAMFAINSAKAQLGH